MDQTPRRFAWSPATARALDGAGYQALLAAQAVWVVAHLGLLAAGWVIAATQIGSALAAPALAVTRRLGPKRALYLGTALAALTRIALLFATLTSPLLLVVIATCAMSATSWLPDLATKQDVLVRSRSPRTLGTLLLVVTIAHALGSAAPTALADPTFTAAFTITALLAAASLVPTLFLVRPHTQPTPTTTASSSQRLPRNYLTAVALLAFAVTGPTAVWASLCTQIVGQTWVALLGLLYILSAALALVPAKLHFDPTGTRLLSILAGASGAMWLVHAGALWFLATMVVSCVWVIAVTGVILASAGHRAGTAGMAQVTTVISLATAASALLTPLIYNATGQVGIALIMTVPAAVSAFACPALLRPNPHLHTAE